MSHKATNWLASLRPDQLTNAEFRVLFHLCDCHNPSKGCFPTQAYLIAQTGVSNGTVNNALNGLEAKGLIARHKKFDEKTRRQRPTRYRLGFELDDPGASDGSGTGAPSPEPSPVSGDGAVSNFDPDPSPVSGQSRLQPTGEKPVKEPVKNPGRAADLDGHAHFWAQRILSGVPIFSKVINPTLRKRMVDLGLVTEAQLEAAGVATG